MGARGVFSNKTCFVFAHEAHLCHRTDFLFEALVAMLRTCVFLRLPYISAAQLRLGACANGSHTEQKSMIKFTIFCGWSSVQVFELSDKQNNRLRSSLNLIEP